MSVREKILLVMLGMGIDISDIQEDSDVYITEYVIDSIMFIRFIVELEEELQIEIPDEVLIMDSIVSLNSFAETVTNVISDYVRC